MGLRFLNLIPRRRRHRVLVGVLLLMVVAWFVVPQLFVPMIRAKLQGMIAGHLDAKLHIGRLMYAPPFGGRARDVRLIGGGSAGAENAGTELLKVRKLDLKLARLPFREGPLVIQNITVHDPEVHLIRTADGRLVGMHKLIKPDSPTAQATQPTSQPAATQPAELEIERPEEAAREAAMAKLSDMFELRHFGIKGGRIVYEDRTRPGVQPVVWKDLSVGMQTTPRSKAVYGYTLEAHNGDLAKLKSRGLFDLDQLLLVLGSLHVEARTAYSEEESPLPAQVQRELRDHQVEGRVVLEADGRFPLREHRSSTFRAAIELRDASGYAPRWDATLDRLSVRLGVERTDAAGPMRLRIESCEAASGDSSARIDKAELLLDQEVNTWSIADVSGRIELGRETAVLPKRSRPVLTNVGARGEVQFTLAASGKLDRETGQYVLNPEDLTLLAYPRNVSLQPPKFSAPLRNIGGGGSVRKERGSRVVVFQDLSFNYGGDPVILTSARLQLPANLNDLKRHTRVEEISGTIDFRRPGPRYPGKFGKVVDSLRPVGPFVIGRDSWFAVAKVEPDLRARADPASPPAARRSRKGDWFFSVSTDSGSFTLTEDRIPLTNLRGDATVSNMLVDVRRLEADVLGGKITGTLQVTPGGSRAFQGRAYLRGIDLDAVSKVYILPETKDAKLTGEGNLDVEFAGSRPPDGGSPLEALRAAGEFEILRGHFWTIPVLGEIVRRAGGDREMTVGEAAGIFEIADRKIILRSAAVASPAVGVQGSGTITLDKQLDLNVVAAPLGDWKDKLRQTNVPVLSDVVGEAAGALQTIVNAATSELLYEFRITGKTSSPQVATVPVPALSDTAAALFSGMLREEKDRRLIESVRAQGWAAEQRKVLPERPAERVPQRPAERLPERSPGTRR
jgi:hypothetical protein